MASVEKQIQVEVAKGILRDKFEDLQAYSASLESFSLQLKGLDDLFDSIHGSLEARFADAESRLKLKQNPPADCFRNVDSESKLKQKKEKQDSRSKRKQKMESEQKQKKGLDPVALKSEGSKVKRKEVRSSNGSSNVELESKRKPHEESSIVSPSVTNSKNSPFLSPTLDWFVTPRPALMLMCGKMDTLGFMVFLNYFSVDFRDEIASALLSAPDPTQLLLSALEISAVKSKSSAIDVELSPESWSYLLQIISMVTPVIKSQVREKAVEHCRNNVVNNSGDEIIFRSLAILILVAYGSESILEERWIFDLVEIAARRPQAAALCRIFGFTDRIPEFVEYLLAKEKRMEALNFIFEFGLLDQFPAYPLLKEHLSLAKKTAKRISKEADNSTESQILGIDIQVAAVNDVLRCIQEHEIECKYNVCNMSTRLEKLGLEKLNLESGAS